MSKSTWTGAVSSDWADADNWTPVGVPGENSDVVIATGAPVASASIGTVNSITDSSDLRFRSGGTNKVTTFLDNSGELRVDRKGGAGGTILNIGGTLTNSGSLTIGNAALSAPGTVTAASLDNTASGEIRLLGSRSNPALLDVTGSAGFGAEGVLSGYVRLAGDSTIEFQSGEITSLANKAQLRLNGNDAFIEDSMAVARNSALTGLASIGLGAYFELENKAVVSTTGSLVNDGHIRLDLFGGDGGSSLTVGGTLTNRGYLTIGNATLSAPDKVTAASLDNTGEIRLVGSSANQALLDVTGSAGFGPSGTLSGYVRVAGDSAIEFKSGQITSLALGAQLYLNGNDAFIEDSTALGSNSALTGLASIRGYLGLHNKAAVSTTGSLVNYIYGHIQLDFVGGGGGGSSLTVAGTLTNHGTLAIGNTTLSAPDTVTAASLDNTGLIHLTGSSANQALLDVTSAGFGTAGVLTGNVQLTGDSAIEFASGQITSLAASAELILNGNSAFIEDSTASGSNSALSGLASIGAGAFFDLENEAAVSTTGALVNDGYVLLDATPGVGGSNLTLAGALTNDDGGVLEIGNATLSAPDKVTAASLDNTLYMQLTGSVANQALLDVSGAAGFGTAGVLSGRVFLIGDSAIEFASGQISTIAAGAALALIGNDAFIEDSMAPGSNSALTGLAKVAGSLYLDDGASLSTTGALVNSGVVSLDFHGEKGGSSLTVAGALTNSLDLAIGNSRLSASVKVTAAALDNTGDIELTGSSANQALLDVTGSAGFGAVGVLSGEVRLTGDSAIEFTSGQISTLAKGASLFLYGNDAFIEDSTAPGSNSALTGLASIGAKATFGLRNKAAASTTGSLVNDGDIHLDFSELERDGGSSLTVAGTLTNSGALDIGNGGLSSSDSATANSFVNNGTVDLIGQGTNFATLDVSGATTNKGSISIIDDTEELAGAVGGAGSFSLSTAHLRFDSSVSAGQIITEGFDDALVLEHAQSFAATISGFGGADTIDAANFLLSGTTFNFVENSGGTGGTLALHDGSLTANILMTGHYSNSSFTLAPDSGTGTLVKFV